MTVCTVQSKQWFYTDTDLYYVRNKVLKVVLMKIHLLWDMKPCHIGKQLLTIQRSLLPPFFWYRQSKTPHIEASGSSKINDTPSLTTKLESSSLLESLSSYAWRNTHLIMAGESAMCSIVFLTMQLPPIDRSLHQKNVFC